MSYTFIFSLQMAVFFCFFLIEKILPARSLPRNKGILQWLIVVNFFALAWSSFYYAVWPNLPEGFFSPSLSAVESGFVLYLLYSFVNYWWHRFKHQSRFIWFHVHRFHHCPSKMESMLAFFRHPVEIVLNTLLIGFFAWLLSFPIFAIAMALVIEGIFEVYHHSNIKTPKKLRFISHVIQTTEMHLVHHQKGVHRYNYGTLSLWDTIFGTKNIPSQWTGEQGIDIPYGFKRLFFYKS